MLLLQLFEEVQRLFAVLQKVTANLIEQFIRRLRGELLGAVPL